MQSMKAAPLWLSAALISGTSWALSPEKLRRDEGGAQLQGQADEVDRRCRG